MSITRITTQTASDGTKRGKETDGSKARKRRWVSEHKVEWRMVVVVEDGEGKAEAS